MHPQQAATPTPPKPQASEEWERALADVMAGGQGASAKLAILSLTHIRDKIGDAEFTRVQRRVHLAVQTVIGKLLGSGDKLFRIGEETYVVIVGSMDIDKAQTLIQQGCTTLAKMFFGQEEYGDIMVKAEVTEIVTDGSREPRRFEITATPKEPTAKLTEIKLEDRPKAKSGISLVPINQKAKSQRNWVSMSNMVDEALELDLNFVPTWDATRKVLSTFTAGDWRALENGQFQDCIAEISGGNHAALAELDAQVIRQTTEILQELFQNKFALLVLLPVHFTSLSTQAGREIVIDALREIPEDLRKIFTVEILGTPEDMGTSLLADRISQIKPYSRNIVLSIENWNAATMRLAACPGVSAVALFLPKPGPLRTRLLQNLPTFTQAVHKMKKLPAAVQLHNHAEIDMAVNAGITFLTGTGVGMPEDLPGNMVRCTSKDLPFKLK